MSQNHILTVAPLTRIALTRDQAFSYTAPRPVSVGALVSVPIGTRVVHGIVLSCLRDAGDAPSSPFTLKSIARVLKDPCLTDTQLAVATHISTHYICPLGIVLSSMVPHRVRWREAHTPDGTHPPATVHLTPTQRALVRTITDANPATQRFFVHAYRRTDKMSVIVGILQSLLADTRRQALYLVPELIHMPAMMAFFARFFPSDTVAVVHGKLGKGAYDRVWEGVRHGTIRLIIGTRRAVFLPFRALGAIVVDEAHDHSHKQWERYPLFDARIVARDIAARHGATLVYTSATPRVVDFADTTLTHLSTTSVPPPRIEIVDMKKERWEKNTSVLSRALIERVKTTLDAGKKILLFVNRQGESAFAVCGACRHVAHCSVCARTLTTLTPTTFFCPDCRMESVVCVCPRCRAPWTHVGVGTGRIHRELKKIFPAARYAVADSATMRTPRAYDTLYRNLADGAVDIIIGTQMITKGWSGAAIGLSVIVDMDNLFSLPAYDANEKAFAFVVQLALRAHGGTLLIQTFQPEHRVLMQACAFDFAGFTAAETDVRTALAFPPAASLIRITYRHADPGNVRTTITSAYNDIRAIAVKEPTLRVSEPHAPLIARQRGKHRMQIIVKNTAHVMPPELFQYLAAKNTAWTVDVDPVQTI